MNIYMKIPRTPVIGMLIGGVTLLCWCAAVFGQTIPGDGPPVTGSESYRDGGADGYGIKIAVMDNGFLNFQAAQAAGDAPLTLGDSIDFVGGGVTTGTDHGTKVVEIIYDHAPAATYYLYKVSSLLDAADFQNAVDEAVAQGVDIISMSITFHNTGWEDNSGDACAAVETATDAGILVFSAAGNSAVQHWRGAFYDPDADNLHNWDEVDEHNDISITAGSTLLAFLQWDTSDPTTDYDLYLYDNPKTTILAQSNNSGSVFEFLQYPSATTQTVKMRITRVSTGTSDFQLFVRGQTGVSTPIQFYTSDGSITSPGNSTQANAVCVGAVDVVLYGSSPGTDGIIEVYSSQGPTNSGNMSPDLCSPTDCSVVTGTSPFGGTSCATPNAAGTAAAFWSSAPYLDASGVRHLLFEMAAIFKDWGDAGFDNVYGRGGIALHTFHAKTFWVDRDAGNISGSSTMPYYFVSHAQDAAAEGGRIVFLGDHYAEPITLDKELLYESIGESAVLGQ